MKKATVSWFEFSQNNSGGRFHVDDKVCHRLFIEADNEAEAIQKAESLGVYFDGVAEGLDCPCCGDRWHSPVEVKFPYQFKDYLYGKDKVFETPREYAQYLTDNYGCTDPDARLFYKSGTIVSFTRNEPNK